MRLGVAGGLDLRTSSRVAAALAGATTGIALTVHVVAAGPVRELLAFDFPRLPDDPGLVLSIFGNNVRVLIVVLAACVVAHVCGKPSAGRLEAFVSRLGARICDVAVAAGCALHVLTIGAAFGAYGERIVTLVLAHAPFELAAFSLALALYTRARRGRLTASRVAATAAAGTALLACGAVLEVYA